MTRQYTYQPCPKCGLRHHNVTTCEKAAAREAEAEAEARRRAVPLRVTFQPREGWRPWGDRLTNYERMGDNLILKNRPQKHGNVIEGSKDGPQEA